jgi:hypothetical protein
MFPLAQQFFPGFGFSLLNRTAAGLADGNDVVCSAQWAELAVRLYFGVHVSFSFWDCSKRDFVPWALRKLSLLLSHNRHITPQGLPEPYGKVAVL